MHLARTIFYFRFWKFSNWSSYKKKFKNGVLTYKHKQRSLAEHPPSVSRRTNNSDTPRISNQGAGRGTSAKSCGPAFCHRPVTGVLHLWHGVLRPAEHIPIPVGSSSCPASGCSKSCRRLPTSS